MTTYDIKTSKTEELEAVYQEVQAELLRRSTLVEAVCIEAERKIFLARPKAEPTRVDVMFERADGTRAVSSFITWWGNRFRVYRQAEQEEVGWVVSKSYEDKDRDKALRHAIDITANEASVYLGAIRAAERIMEKIPS